MIKINQKIRKEKMIAKPKLYCTLRGKVNYFHIDLPTILHESAFNTIQYKTIT